MNRLKEATVNKLLVIALLAVFGTAHAIAECELSASSIVNAAPQSETKTITVAKSLCVEASRFSGFQLGDQANWSVAVIERSANGDAAVYMISPRTKGLATSLVLNSPDGAAHSLVLKSAAN